jgi:hypothetical protein
VSVSCAADARHESAEAAMVDGIKTHGLEEGVDLAAAFRKALPSSVANRCRIEVIVRMDGDESSVVQPPTPVEFSDPSHSEEEGR